MNCCGGNIWITGVTIRRPFTDEHLEKHIPSEALPGRLSAVTKRIASLFWEECHITNHSGHRGKSSSETSSDIQNKMGNEGAFGVDITFFRSTLHPIDGKCQNFAPKAKSGDESWELRTFSLENAHCIGRHTFCVEVQVVLSLWPLGYPVLFL